MKISVIISTYNMPDWLEKVLWGYANQSYQNFEIIIADDGSDTRTQERIKLLQKETGLEIYHLWHEDQGFRKPAILNKAIMETHTEYLIFTDGDCIPRKDFLEIHLKHAKRGYFLSGGYCKLPICLSKKISKNDIVSGIAFDPGWLKSGGLKAFSPLRKLSAGYRFGTLYDFFTLTGATFNGCNSSVWKADIIAVNGFDERMGYGGLDREIGERLSNFGLKSKQIRNRAIVIHLDHSRGYKSKETWDKNLSLRKSVKKSKSFRTNYGIKKNLF